MGHQIRCHLLEAWFGAHQGLQRVSEDLADLQRVIVPIVEGDLLQTHFDSDLVQGLAVDHLTSHLGKKSLSLIWIAFKKIVCHYTAEHCITQVLQPFIILVCVLPD